MATVLGMDLGSDSIGWALVDREANKIVASGVRLFRTGEGGDKTPNQERREKRLARRQRRYRLARYRTLTNLLVANNLLPVKLPGEDRHAYLNRIDKQLLNEVRVAIASGTVTLPEADAINVSQRLPYAFCYFLRYFCAKFDCPPHWYGRAFLHMARFRGFSYQLKTREEVESEASKNKDGDIKGERLKEKLEKEGKLLAEEFIRRCLANTSISGNRFISRFSLMDEFIALRDKLLNIHSEMGPLFSPSERAGIHSVLFKQRGIRVKRSSIGRCPVFPNSERASKLLPEYQEFKVRQALANVRLFGSVASGVRGLDTLEKEKLYAAISTNGKISKNDFTNLIGLKKKKDDLQISSNFDEMKDHLKDELQLVINEIFRGDEQSQAAADVFRDGVQRRELACTLLRFNNQDAAIRFLEKRFSLTADQAVRALTAKKPDGRAIYSAKALKFFIEELKRGVQPHEIRNSLGSRSNLQSLNKLIPVINAFPQLRDPAVVRVLSQVRAVVNEVILVHGKPLEIRIELARSQKLSARERQTIDRLNKSLKQEREEIAAWLGERGVAASDTNVLRFRLWRESSHQCLYCGCMLSFNQVFASNRSQIDHIWPYSRTLDDRYINKLLVCATCNLEKGNATPFEKWGSNSEKWRQITSRFDDWVEKKVKTDDVFRDLSDSLQNLAGGNRISVKRKRVLETKSDIVEGFLARQLHTTGYASRLARDYLGLLYGEQNSVKVSSGFITARYRFALRERFAAEVRAQLPNFLDHSAQKTRNDHRHHAFDAIFIALSDDRARMALQREWANGEKNPIPPPWEGFGSDLAATLREITPSLFFPQRDAARISGKAGTGGQRSRGQWAARGALHDETARTEEDKGSRARVHPSHGTAWHNVKENAFVMIGKNSSGELHWAAMSLWDWCDRVRVEGYVYPKSFVRGGKDYNVVGIFRLHEAFKLNGQEGIWRLVGANDQEFLFVPITDARMPRFLRDEKIAIHVQGTGRFNSLRPQRVLVSPSGQLTFKTSGDEGN